MTGKQLLKVVSWIVKLSVLVLQVPVTWAVAGHAFGDLGSVVYVGGWAFETNDILQFAAVLLADGVLAYNWIALETDSRAAPEVRARYVAGAWIQYLVMLVIAFSHGEGIVGVAFRVSFAVALAGSTWDTIARTAQRLRAAADAGEDWRVKAYNRRVTRHEKVAQRDSESRVFMVRLDAEEEVAVAEIRQDAERRLAEIPQVVLEGNGRGVATRVG